MTFQHVAPPVVCLQSHHRVGRSRVFELATRLGTARGRLDLLSTESRSSHKNEQFLSVSGNQIRYVGPGTEDKDAASVRTRLPARDAFHYFEVEVVNNGQLGFIGIGFSQTDFEMCKLPGWAQHSYGYHGDDGKAFGSDHAGRPYGPLFGTGDIIGVAYNRADRTISYFKNGFEIGVAFSNVQEEELYPTIGLRSPDEEVSVNFGTTPFRTEIAPIRVKAAERMRHRICSLQPPEEQAGVPGALGSLILGHLKHCGHFATAAQVAQLLSSQAKPASPHEIQNFHARESIAGAVRAGDVDRALAEVEAYAPGALEAHPRLLFRLRCQKFIELVRRREALEAIAYGKSEVAGKDAGAMTDEDRECLKDTLSLLAYDQPEESPHGALMSEGATAELADAVDEALLQHSGQPQHSSLEHLLRTLLVVAGELRQISHPGATLADFDSMVALADPAVKHMEL